MELNKIYNMDCLEGMKEIPDGSIDCIICDLPYGTTACAWDNVIPFKPLWEQYNRIIKNGRGIILFGSEPFSTMLRYGNLQGFCYDWIWDKRFGANFVLADKQPLKTHEIISVFSNNGKMPLYIPQKRKRDVPIKLGKNITDANNAIPAIKNSSYDNKVYTTKCPETILHYSCRTDRGLHPTQKPVDLFRYLIRTYSNLGETILDNCMGSGTTAVAAVLENRKFIGFETDKDYFEKANKRLRDLTGPFRLYGNIGE